MILQWTIYSFFLFSVSSKEVLKYISRSYTSHLSKYTSYLDSTLLHFQIPSDVLFVSLKIEVEEKRQSIFPCKAENVDLYFKYGSPPVINPDGSKFPSTFCNISRPQPYYINFTSHSPAQYINLTSPTPGIYFVSTFLAYTDPRYDGINQEGLVPKCNVYLDIELYISIAKEVEIVIKDVDMEVTLPLNRYAIYKFFAPENVDHVLLTIGNNVSCKDCDFFIIRMQPHNVPSMFKSIKNFDIPVANLSTQNYTVNIWTPENAWYYLRFQFTNKTFSLINEGFFTFRLKFFPLPELINENVTLNVNNSNFDTYVPDPVLKWHRDGNISNIMPYNEYDLVRERNSDSFVYAYDLRPKKNGKVPLNINVTNDKFTILKFVIRDSTDSGGTAQIHLAVNPNIKHDTGKRIVETDPEGNQIVACVRKGVRELPLWPHNCFFNNMSPPSPIFVNKTVENASVMIPYPESGTWFISIRLFCGSCEPCNCSDHCQGKYETCTQVCEENCEPEQCNNCINTCRELIIGEDGCKGCDCIGGCKRNNASCNASIVFEVSSFACVDGTCGENGKCVFSISEGFVLTSCFCTNNCRGWDCSDNSQVNHYSTIVLEMLLLTLSNLMFVPAVYLALKRHYYIQSLTYTVLCLSSTFYHACDAGENIISYCLTRLNVLQFSDFFCALLSFWVTLMAIAYLPEPLMSILHMLGAILLAFGTTYNKMSVWLFVFPALGGIFIILVSWFVKYKKLKHVFPSKRYLKRNFPIGVVVVTIGLITFAFLQTRNNYKYLHSLWHILMAIGIIILLPDKDTFLPIKL